MRICRELLGRIGEITRAETELRAEIATMIRPLAPGLLAISGVGDLIAARLLVETGGARFASEPSSPGTPAARRSRSPRAGCDGTDSPVWATAN